MDFESPEGCTSDDGVFLRVDRGGLTVDGYMSWAAWDKLIADLNAMRARF